MWLNSCWKRERWSEEGRKGGGEGEKIQRRREGGMGRGRERWKEEEEKADRDKRRREGRNGGEEGRGRHQARGSLRRPMKRGMALPSSQSTKRKGCKASSCRAMRATEVAMAPAASTPFSSSVSTARCCIASTATSGPRASPHSSASRNSPKSAATRLSAIAVAWRQQGGGSIWNKGKPQDNRDKWGMENSRGYKGI